MRSAHCYDIGMAYAVESWGGWVDAVIGLRDATPEMLASYDKRFKASYRLAVNNPAVSKERYFVGQAEAINRENADKLNTWAIRTGAKELRVQVVAITLNGHAVLDMPFNPRTMQMLPEARLTLIDGGQTLQRYLPIPAANVLPESDVKAEPLTAEERVQVLAQMRRLTAGSTREQGQSSIVALAAGLEAH